MCRALVLLCEGVSGLEVDDLHLWIDYTCIPQKNVWQQRLAIGALSVYASACTFFLVVAPDTRGRQINGTARAFSASSYSARGWCRLEQWARLTSGARNMFLYADDALASISPDGEIINSQQQAHS